jgi:hypothetical protein
MILVITLTMDCLYCRANIDRRQQPLIRTDLDLDRACRSRFTPDLKRWK